MPSGQPHLMINLGEDQFRTYSGPDCATVRRINGAVLAGPHGRPVAIDTMEQRWLAAVEFRVGGAAAFFPIPISEACNQVIELDALWGREGSLLRGLLCEAATPKEKFCVLETVLLKRLIRPQDPAIVAAASHLERGMSVAEVPECLGLLPKTFGRRFRNVVGLSPKRFSRVRRLQRVLRSLNKPASAGWCMVAAEHGYTDQAHFIHDFRDLTGITPSLYRPCSPQRRNHVPIALPGK